MTAAGARTFSAVEGFESALADFVRHTTTGVADRELQIFARANVADLVGCESDILRRDRKRARSFHGVAGVDGQVKDRVLQLVRVDEYRPGVGAKPGLDLDSLTERAVEQFGHAANQLAAIDTFRKQRLRTSE